MSIAFDSITANPGASRPFAPAWSTAMSLRAMSGAWHRTWLMGTRLIGAGRLRAGTAYDRGGVMAWRDWIRTVEVEPSLYAADFARLGDQIEELLRAGCRIFHFDVGDGHFVEPVTIGPVVLESIAPLVHEAGGVLDCHLMVDNPLRHFPQIARAGGDSATFHYEVVDDVPATIAAAREHGLQVGVAFNPESEPEDVAAVAADADLVLCMSIHPGYSGQKFMPDALERIARLRSALPEPVYVQVDGGIDDKDIRSANEAGAELLVAGSAIFGGDAPARAYEGLVRDLA
jgi:ribulose-phosphate 3-epimerase